MWHWDLNSQLFVSSYNLKTMTTALTLAPLPYVPHNTLAKLSKIHLVLHFGA